MRIGIIAFHKAMNYGAVLQMYALYTYLKQQGHDPFVIDFKQTYPDGYLKWRIGYLFKHPFDIFTAVKNRLFSKRDELCLKQGFHAFLNRFITFTETAQTLDELQQYPPAADLYICGSDQIWNPNEIGFYAAYFLDFGPTDVKRISYGASFGRKEIPPEYVDVLIMHLKRFEAISVREASGVEIVEQLTGRDATQVLDPTLLLDDYFEVIDDSLTPSGKYILVYRLHQERRLTKWMSDLINNISRETGLPVYTISPNNKYRGLEVGKQLHPSPSEFLGLIKDANLVITNSFHGTVFAILFNRNFITCARDCHGDRQNLRMTELLDGLGLLQHFIAFGSESNSLSVARTSVDYESVYRKLTDMRHGSYDYLKKNLTSYLKIS